MRATKEYNEKVCSYLLNRYLEQGIKNGFVDYQISGLPSNSAIIMSKEF